MRSKAYTHYPQFKYRDGQKLLWNPILRKVFKNRPEERVRLQLIEYLLLEAGFSRHRISFESPVKLAGDKSKSRTDLICYTNEFDPLLLTECKSTEVKLDEKAALQVARYNQKVGAPFILVSNGMLDFWFVIDGDQVQPLQEIPGPFSSSNTLKVDFAYWNERGFAGHESHPSTRKFIRSTCKALFRNPLKPVKFLTFEQTPAEFALTNYYRIFSFEDGSKLACTLSASPYGGTRLNLVFNRKGANVAFLTASLDLIAEDQPDNTHLQSARGALHFDLREKAGFSFETKITHSLSTFKELLAQNS